MGDNTSSDDTLGETFARVAAEKLEQNLVRDVSHEAREPIMEVRATLEKALAAPDVIAPGLRGTVGTVDPQALRPVPRSFRALGAARLGRDGDDCST